MVIGTREKPLTISADCKTHVQCAFMLHDYAFVGDAKNELKCEVIGVSDEEINSQFFARFFGLGVFVISLTSLIIFIVHLNIAWF
jgi:hypothetical protein